MDLSTCLRDLLPEFTLVVGACVVLLTGIVRSGAGAGAGVGVGAGASLNGALAVLTVLVALAATCWAGPPATDVHPPGLLLTPLLHYVRLGALLVGGLILLCSMHLPVAEERAEFFSLVLLSICGLQLTAASNDLLVLFFAIELVSVPTYVLVSLSRQDKRASEAAVKYFFLGAMSAALMVYGFSFLFGSLGGHTTMIAVDGQEALSTVASESGQGPFVVIGLLLAFAGIFFKLAAVPFHMYAPDVYEGAASPVTGLLGFLPKFAGLVAATKLLSVFQWNIADQVYWLLWAVAALTMTAGNAAALLQSNVKRILAYSSIAHSGYMLIGLLVGPATGSSTGPMRDGIAAMLFYMVVYGAMNLGAFAVLSCLAKRGEAVEELKDIEGLSTKRPGLALAMAICCFSLMGFPPTAGLLGKVYIFSSAFSVGDSHPFGGSLVVLAVIGVLNSAVGAAYYLRIVAACYNKKPRGDTEQVGGWALRWGVALCSIAMIVVFVWPRGLAGEARVAAANLTPETAEAEVAAISQAP